MPTLIQSRSSMFQSYSYDKDQSVLVVVFSNGGVYEYYDVPPEAIAGLEEAESQSKYFLTYIKPKYRFEKV